MRIAIAAHDDRVSPVLDVARLLVVIDVDDGAERSRRELDLSGVSLTARVREIKDAAIGVLICGAISRPLEAALIAEGIQVIPQICGPTHEVLAAFLSQQLTGERYLMPGCCGRRHGQCHGNVTNNGRQVNRGRGMGKQGVQGRRGPGRGCGFGQGRKQSGGKDNTGIP